MLLPKKDLTRPANNSFDDFICRQLEVIEVEASLAEQYWQEMSLIGKSQIPWYKRAIWWWGTVIVVVAIYFLVRSEVQTSSSVQKAINTPHLQLRQQQSLSPIPGKPTVTRQQANAADDLTGVKDSFIPVQPAKNNVSTNPASEQHVDPAAIFDSMPIKQLQRMPGTNKIQSVPVNRDTTLVVPGTTSDKDTVKKKAPHIIW